MSAYYNEFDAEKAEWIRELIKAGIIAPGDVDERSILDVRPDDIRGYRQCHFFAGIGVWSYALRLAGWPDDRECWSGSCPCPSFSCAGKGEGFDDPRHLWPEWFRLIRECRPAIAFGEQIDSAIGHGWLDLVGMDLESEAYAIAAAVLPAASVGAPHKRNRLYFVAERGDAARRGLAMHGSTSRDSGHAAFTDEAGECADAEGRRYDRWRTGQECDATDGGNKTTKRTAVLAEVTGLRNVGLRSDTDGRQSSNGDVQRSGEQRLLAEDRGTGIRSDSERNGGRSDLMLGEAQVRIADGRDSATGDGSDTNLPTEARVGHDGREMVSESEPERPDLRRESIREYANRIGATRGFWADCDWWYGRDGKFRPIEPGILPLAHGVAARVLKLRGYGDAICAETAKAFIESYRRGSGVTIEGWDCPECDGTGYWDV